MKMKEVSIRLIVAVMMVFSILAVPLLISENVSAHAPTAIYPTYKEGTLTVYIDHASDDPSTHYIKTVTVSLNNVEYLSETYTSQTIDDKGKGMVTYSYIVVASEGDVISVTAKCSIDGSATGKLTVGSSDKDDPKDDPKDYPPKDDPDNVGDSNPDGESSQDNDNIIFLLGAIIGVLVVIVVLIAMLLKKQKGTPEKGTAKKDKINKNEWTSCPKCGSSIRMGQLSSHIDTVHPNLSRPVKDKMIERVTKRE